MAGHDYDVLEDGVVVGRIFLAPAAPAGRASGHNGDIRRAAHGYEATREAAIAKSWAAAAMAGLHQKLAE
jgi:hypothetical protein